MKATSFTDSANTFLGFNQWLEKLKNRQDVVLAMVMFLAIFMMIVPLPTLLVDVLIALNITFAIIILMMSVYIREPTEFSAFPSVLLITTLYRLSLTVSTSRLILLQHDAGEIITTFGNFAVGGNLAVGLIVFAIITVVQFIVITKGAERVAEVSARFSLDAMPGKQMSIDNDLRSGSINAEDAKRLRMTIQKESQLYGAMDGAMKFVKGDAIASIIVILVNILGGISVGVFMHNMSASESVSTYAILSVGDGLVTQIPALLISIASGILVTRIPEEERRHLAAELSSQVMRQYRALFVVSAMLVVCAFLPGFPTIIFLAVAAVIGIAAFKLSRHPDKSTEQGKKATVEGGKTLTDQQIIGAQPLVLIVNSGIVRKGNLAEGLNTLRHQKWEGIGLPFPEITLIGVENLAEWEFEFLLYQESVLKMTLRPLHLVEATFNSSVMECEVTEILPFNGLTLKWVTKEQASALKGMGIVTHQQQESLLYLVSLVLDRYASELVGVQETCFLINQMEKNYAELVRELQRQLPVSRIADVLQRLVSENVSIRDLRAVFEALVEWAPREKDPVMLSEYARLGLKRHIAGKYRNGGWINAWAIGGNIEQMMRESIRQTSAGSYSALSREQCQRIIYEIQAALQRNAPDKVVLLTSIDVRRFFRKLIERDLFNLPVLSFQELGDESQLKILGHIEWIEEASEMQN